MRSFATALVLIAIVLLATDWCPALTPEPLLWLQVARTVAGLFAAGVWVAWRVRGTTGARVAR